MLLYILEPEQNSSLDWVFERSGNHEELCSSLSEQPTVSGKVDDGKKFR